jgi:hypothetical protein
MQPSIGDLKCSSLFKLGGPTERLIYRPEKGCGPVPAPRYEIRI